MSENNGELVPVFIPTLCVVLLSAEDKKGEPLTHEEVMRIRDEAACVMVDCADARKMNETRGYQDIDPENCWYEWQQLRRQMGRTPDLDPGPQFKQIRSTDPEYQKTIHDARASLHQFRAMLPGDGTPRPDAMVKTEITQGDNRAFMWLSNTRKSGSAFVAEFFEVPRSITKFQLGDQLEVPEESILDWMVNDNGVLHGGFSIRYQ